LEQDNKKLPRRITELEKTEIKCGKLEEELRKSDEKYRKFIRTLPDVVVVLDTEGKIIELTNRTCELYGIDDADELLGKSGFDLVAPEEFERTKANFRKTLVEGSQMNAEYVAIKKDGSRITVEMNAAVIRDENENPIAFFAVLRDITERKISVEALLESKERFRALVENINDWVWETDEKGTYTYASPKCSKILGYEPDELIGKTPFDLMTDDEAERIGKKFLQFAKSRQSFERLINRNIHKDGSEVILETNGTAILDDIGNLIGYRGIDRDITKRMRNEEKLKRLTTILRTISNVSQLLIKKIDRETLIQKVCDSLTRISGYYNAWIVLLDESNKAIAIAESGLGEKFSPATKALKRGELTNCACKALNSSKVIVLNDPLTECSDCPLSSEYANRSGLSIRLGHLNNIYGVLTVSIPKEFANDIREQSFVCEVAGDIALALHNIKLDEEHIQAQRALKESEQRYSTLFKQSPNPMLLVDLSTGKIVEFNVRAYKNLGYTRKEFEKLDISDFEIIESAKEIRLRIKKVIEKGAIVFETKHVTKTGEIRNVIVNIKVITINDKPYGQTIFVDITDRKKAEIALRESEEKFRTFMESSSDLMYISDIDGNITYINKAMSRTLGYTKREMNGINITQILSKKILEIFPAKLKKLIENGKLTLEATWITKGGDEILGEIKLVAIYDSDGEFAGTRAVFRDITERKFIEDELRKRKHDLGERVKELNCLYSISKIVEKQGNSLEDLIKEITILIRLPWRYPEIACSRIIIEEQEFKTANWKETPWKQSSEIIVNDEQIGFIEISYLKETPQSGKNPFLDEENHLLDAITERLGRIIERKQAEEKIERYASELEASNKELEQFASVASHDLQEPLRMVSSYLQLIDQRYKDKLDKDGEEFIEFAVDGAIRMKQLINDLLLYSRVGTHGKPFAPTDTEAVFNRVLLNLKATIEESNAVITHDHLPTITADSSQLNQLFQNLISNAIKFKGDKTPRVHISTQKEGDEWVFTIQDNGIGIDSKYSERIFKIFERLHARSEYSGTGIGLAICKKIVERHNGNIWMESTQGNGAKFHFTIPIIKGEHNGY